MTECGNSIVNLDRISFPTFAHHCTSKDIQVTLRIVSLFTVMVFIGVLSGCSDETAPAPTTGSITGKVLLGKGLTPVAGAIVTTLPPTASVITDSTGSYRVLSAAAGTYQITAQRSDVGTGSASISVRAGEATQANIVIDGGTPETELPPVTSGLAVFFPLDNSATVLAGDSFVSGNILYDALAATDRKNRQAKATRFLGKETSYLIATLDQTLQNVPLTISFWLRKDAAPKALETILSKYLHPSGEGIHIVYDNQTFTAAYMTGGFENYSRSDAQHPALATWVHVAYICGQTGCALYIDGKLQRESPWNKGRALNTVTNEPFYIGFTRSTATSGSPLTSFNGAIDDLAWYSRVLTSAEIKKLSDDR